MTMRLMNLILSYELWLGYMGIACAPNAPRTADATAITILRSLSHQVDFVDIIIGVKLSK